MVCCMKIEEIILFVPKLANMNVDEILFCILMPYKYLKLIYNYSVEKPIKYLKYGKRCIIIFSPYYSVIQ